MCGDIVGRSGRDVVIDTIPKLKNQLNLDWIIVNGENAAAGFGITPTISQDLFNCGVDVITTGNHIWDQRNIVAYINQEARLIRPLNYAPQTPGQGYVILEKPYLKRLMVINVMGRLFMEHYLDDPFRAVEDLLLKHPLSHDLMGSIIIDFHGEATSEKIIFAHYFDGKVSAVMGTHTHVPTADGRILSEGTAFQTDLGMCGDYYSVIGMSKETAIPKMLKKGPTDRLTPAKGPATFSGVIMEIDNKTGLALKIEPVIIGPHLQNRIPLA